MDRAEEEGVLRITAEYVAEVQAGHAPRLGDYLERYPQYADAIAEFVAYYHAVETDLPGEAVVMPQLSEESSRAMEHAWERIQQSSSSPMYPEDRALADQLPSLLTIANKRHLSLAELAVKTGLSQDIIEKLERRMIVASTLPQELLRRFATLLQEGQAQGTVPTDGIALWQAQGTAPTGLSGQTRPGAYGNVGTSLGRARVAEAGSSYQIEGQPDVHAQSFREAIEQSAQLTDEQKGMWRDILSREGL